MNNLVVWLQRLTYGAAIGSLLLCLSDWVIDPVISLPPAPIQVVPGYHTRLRDAKLVQALLTNRQQPFNLEQTNELVFATLAHTDQRWIRPYENYLLWFGSMFYAPLGRTQMAARIVRGQAGWCSEAVIVLNEIARRNGVPTRIINLNGHIVTAVQTPAGWRVADPDYGIVYDEDLAQLAAPLSGNMIRRKLLQKGYGDAMIDNYLAILQSTHDNQVLAIQARLSPRLWLIERIAEWGKWIVPLLCLCLAQAQKRWLRFAMNKKIPLARRKKVSDV